MASPSTMVISDFGRARFSQRTRSLGKQTCTIEITSAPVGVVVDAHRLGVDVAVALRNQLQADIRAISEDAKPATIKARKVEARAFVAGAAWAVERYTGGRTGATPPNIHATRMFNNSGRFADSLAVRANKRGEFVVNCAANRLNPNDFKGGVNGAQYQLMISELARLVPTLSQPMATGNMVDLAQRRVAKMQHRVGRMGQSGPDVAREAEATLDAVLEASVKALQAAAKAVA